MLNGSDGQTYDEAVSAHGAALDVPPTYSFVNAITLGWGVFRRAYWPLVGTTALSLLLWAPSLVIYVSLMMTATPDNFVERVFVSYGVIMLFALLAAVIYVGGAAIVLRTIGGERPSIWMIRHALMQSHKIVGVNLVVTLGLLALCLIVFVVVYAAMSTIGSGSTRAIGLLVSLIVMLCLYVGMMLLMSRIAFATYFFVDPVWAQRGMFGVRHSVFGALAANWRMTSGRTWSVLALLFVLMMGASMCFYAFMLPLLFFGAPMATATMASAYHLLARDDERAKRNAVTAGVVAESAADS